MKYLSGIFLVVFLTSNVASAEERGAEVALKILEGIAQGLSKNNTSFVNAAYTGDTIQYGSVVGIYTEEGHVRLDLGTRAMKEAVPASNNNWATRLRIRRLDGPNSGAIRYGHVVGIFTEEGHVRLDLGTRAMKEAVPANHNSWATQLRIRRLDGPNSGAIRYGDVIGVFTEEGHVRLDLGTRAMKEAVPATHNSWATRLRIKPK